MHEAFPKKLVLQNLENSIIYLERNSNLGGKMQNNDRLNDK